MSEDSMLAASIPLLKIGKIPYRSLEILISFLSMNLELDVTVDRPSSSPAVRVELPQVTAS